MKGLARCVVLILFIIMFSSQYSYCKDFDVDINFDIDNELTYSELNHSSAFNVDNWRKIRRINDTLKVMLESDIKYSDFSAHLNLYHRDRFRNFTSRTILTRAFIDYDLSRISFLEEANVRVGRQRVPWGSGIVWNPADEINTLIDLLNPTEEVDQIKGEDALKFDFSLQDFSLTAVSVFDDYSELETVALRCRSVIGESDLSLMGSFGEDKPTLVGVDFSKVILDDFTLWGEAALKKKTQIQDDKDEHFSNYVIGGSYSFPTEKYLQARMEFYHREEGFKDIAEYQVFLNKNPDKSVRVAEIMRNYLYLGATYDVTNDIIFDIHTIYNLDDSSILFNPELKIIIDSRTSLSFHGVLLEGDSDSEFGSLPQKRMVVIKLRRNF